MDDAEKDIRWQQRLQNYKAALARLRSILLLLSQEPENEVYPLAVIQAFEFTFELAWKTMKDYIEAMGIEIEPFPRPVIRQAFNSKIITEGQVWLDILQARNLMSHAYDEEKATLALTNIQTLYVEQFSKLEAYFAHV